MNCSIDNRLGYLPVPQKGTVVGLGARVPRIPMNINDPDYEEKSANPDNYYAAVLVKRPDGKVHAVCLQSGESYRMGDEIWYASTFPSAQE